mmetsp:Transcript_65806/g.154925  ORF Transcript_65806/g.154925 Transcript_65806/m.154925 type:complete len:223 (-) Transcript_65806:783-1451(-)
MTCPNCASSDPISGSTSRPWPPDSGKRCGSKLLKSPARGCPGLSRQHSMTILGRTKNSSTSQSVHMFVKAGANLWATRNSATISLFASKSNVCRTYRAPISQLSSQSTSLATSPTLLQRCGSTRSRHFFTSRKYRRIASKEPTTSTAMDTPALLETASCMAAAAKPLPSPAATMSLLVRLKMRRTFDADSKMSWPKSSRPFRRKLATEFRCAIPCTNALCTS